MYDLCYQYCHLGRQNLMRVENWEMEMEMDVYVLHYLVVKGYYVDELVM